MTGWFLVGFAESQGDRNKSPETCGEKKQSTVCWKTLMCFLFETPESLLQIRKIQYFNSVLFSPCCPILNIYVAISDSMIQIEIDGSLEWKLLSG